MRTLVGKPPILRVHHLKNLGLGKKSVESWQRKPKKRKARTARKARKAESVSTSKSLTGLKPPLPRSLTTLWQTQGGLNQRFKMLMLQSSKVVERCSKALRNQCETTNGICACTYQQREARNRWERRTWIQGYQETSNTLNLASKECKSLSHKSCWGVVAPKASRKMIDSLKTLWIVQWRWVWVSGETHTGANLRAAPTLLRKGGGIS